MYVPIILEGVVLKEEQGVWSSHAMLACLNQSDLLLVEWNVTRGYKDIHAIFFHLDTNSQGESHEMSTHTKERVYERAKREKG